MNNHFILDNIIIEAKRKACTDAFLKAKKLLPKKINQYDLKEKIINFAEQIDCSYIANYKNPTLFFISNKVYSDTLHEIKKFLRRYNA